LYAGVIPAGYSATSIGSRDEWLHFGGWAGVGLGGSHSSTYYLHRESNTWCNDYTAASYGTANSDNRYVEVYYTGETYDCGLAGTTLYKMTGRNGSGGSLITPIAVFGQYSQAIAATEIKASTYWSPLGGVVCFGASISGGSCTNNSAERLQLNIASWSDWIASPSSLTPSWSGYSTFWLSSWYRIQISGIY
jgi:hypothetical protein